MIIFLIFLFFINFLIILKLQKFAKFINIYDKPDNNLKLHKKTTPILGGVILIINYFFF